MFGHVLAAFRYGREDLDVLGLTFRKDLYLAAEQVSSFFLFLWCLLFFFAFNYASL